MSYRIAVSELEEEYRVKRQRAEFLADQRRNQLMACYPQLKSADDKLNAAMRDYGFSRATREEVDAARNHFYEVLEFLGINKRELEPVYECRLCSDTGRTVVGRCHCFMQKLYARLYTEAKLVEGQSFSTFDLSVFPDVAPDGYKSSQRKLMKEARNQAKEYAAQFPKNERENILLLGPAGVGKTFLANCIAREILEKGYTVLATNSFGLFERLTDRLHGEDVDLEHIRQADLLFIDDLGMEPMLNNFTIEYLFEILNERLKRKKHTIITSNLSAGEMRDRYTERITSRLLDRAHSLVIFLPGKDVRLIKR